MRVAGTHKPLQCSRDNLQHAADEARHALVSQVLPSSILHGVFTQVYAQP